jgi:predicted site-specific integrase-resolvase
VDTSTPIKPNTIPNRIGYARVSSIGQNLDSQMDSLKQAGCIKIFTDKLTGSRMERPGWEELLTGVQARVKALCSKGYSTMRREKIGAI